LQSALVPPAAQPLPPTDTDFKSGRRSKTLVFVVAALLAAGAGAGVLLKDRWMPDASPTQTSNPVEPELKRNDTELAEAKARAGAAEKAAAKLKEENEAMETRQREEQAAVAAKTAAKLKEESEAMEARQQEEEARKLAEQKRMAEEADPINFGAVGKTFPVSLPGSVPLTLCYCPAGSFTMGSPASEEGRNADEKQMPVTLTKAFWLAQTEFTQAQWRAVIGTNPSEFNGDNLPVESVIWEDVQDCLKVMNSRVPLPSGWKWVLPTEAQWEYACRAGTTGAYAGELDQMAWYSANSAIKTHLVGTKKANAWGLYDMHGNVWEWCHDLWDGSTPLSGGTDPLGTAGSAHVLRGGSWFNLGPPCRSASRRRPGPGTRRDYLGFRPAAVPSGSR